MSKEVIKVGDRVLVITYGLFGDIFYAHIRNIKKGLFWNTYLCEWIVNDMDYGRRYKEVGFMRSWNIICKD